MHASSETLLGLPLAFAALLLAIGAAHPLRADRVGGDDIGHGLFHGGRGDNDLFRPGHPAAILREQGNAFGA